MASCVSMLLLQQRTDVQEHFTFLEYSLSFLLVIQIYIDDLEAFRYSELT